MTATLPPESVLFAIRAAPRDTTIVIEDNATLADSLHDAGYAVVSVGAKSRAPSVESGQALADNWSVVTCRSSSAMCLGSKPLGRLVEHMAHRAMVNGNTARFRSRGWTENLLRNFHALLEPSFGAYTNGLRGVPAFIVGAGPSLDEDVEHIRGLGSKGLVIGINAAARLLEPGGVAMTVEGNDVRHKLGELGEGIIRAFSLFTPAEVLNHGSGPLLPIFSAELAAIPEWLTGYQRLACSAFGGTAAVSLAERLGCDPIILVGHDFHLRDGGRIYPECLGIGETRARRDGKYWRYEWDEKLRSQPRQNPIRGEDYYAEISDGKGGVLASTPDLVGVAAWMSQVTERVEGRTFIQATAGGAPIKGWQSRGLGELGLPDCDYELSPAENGLSAGMLLAWLEGQMRATEIVFAQAERLEREQSRAAIESLRTALRGALLVEPWCHPSVMAVAEERRREAPGTARYEHDMAMVDARCVASAIIEDVPSLLGELVHSASVIRAMGGSQLENCKFPTGAADDTLRCALRSMEPYERLSPIRKAASWLTA